MGLRTKLFRYSILLALLLIAACGSAPQKSAPAKATTSIDYDRFSGACPDWQRYMQSKGVQDCIGGFHPGWFGATRCVVGSSGYTFTPKREKSWLGRTCYSVELPRNGSQFKILQACTRIVDWVPNTPITAACRDQRQNWLDRILVHEKQHINQCETAVWQANQRWASSSHKFEACAFNEKSAFKELNEKIQAELETERRRVMDTIDNEFDAFHRTAQGQPIVTNCAPCSQ